MYYHDLRDFIAQLERLGELKRVQVAVDPHLEMTEICDRVLRAGGPALCRCLAAARCLSLCNARVRVGG